MADKASDLQRVRLRVDPILRQQSSLQVKLRRDKQQHLGRMVANMQLNRWQEFRKRRTEIISDHINALIRHKSRRFFFT